MVIGNSDLDVLFLLCKQKTAYEMRISDWSSDVCSSELRTLYDGRLQRYKEVSAAAGITASNVSVVDEAAVPINPSSPDLLLNLALALLAGVVIAGGAVFVREQLDDAIRAPEDIERKLGLPTLGAIPISGADDLREELALPRSPMAEAYNSLRTALLYRSEEHTSELQSLMRI